MCELVISTSAVATSLGPAGGTIGRLVMTIVVKGVTFLVQTIVSSDEVVTLTVVIAVGMALEPTVVTFLEDRVFGVTILADAV